MTTARVKTSSVFTKIRKANTRVIVNEGSSRSTKTISILQFIIQLHLAVPGLKTTISRKKLTWLKVTVIPDFEEVMKKHFMIWNDNNWNKTESTYEINGGSICFVGLDEPQKLHGRKQDVSWINEAVEADYKDFEQLAIRTTKTMLLDYNPSYEQHWIYDKVIPRDDCTFIKSTYKDNPFLDPLIRQEIERLEPTPQNIAQGTADEVSWKIYGLGERAAHRGIIFSKVKIVRELPPKDDWKKCVYGLDFGFTNDPTSLSQLVLAHGELWLKQLIYKRGLTNIINPHNPSQESIEGMMLKLGIPKNATIWADAAEPKSIQDLKNSGWFNIGAAIKGPDSIINGINTILRYNVNLTEDSVDAIKEKNNYKWKEDRSGNATNEPIDMWNHFWDSVRYAAIMELKQDTYSLKSFTKM